MKATTMTFEEFSRRIETSAMVRTPQQIALAKLEEVALAANKLGLEGHRVSRVEIIITKTHDAKDDLVTVRIVPEFKLKAQP